VSNWKYTDSSNRVVIRKLPNGGTESCLASVLPENSVIEPADGSELPIVELPLPADEDK
jgi:hypothetical protein